MSPFSLLPPARVNRPTSGYPTHPWVQGRFFGTGVTSTFSQSIVFLVWGVNFMRNIGQGGAALDPQPRAGEGPYWRRNTCVYC